MNNISAREHEKGSGEDFFVGVLRGLFLAFENIIFSEERLNDKVYEAYEREFGEDWWNYDKVLTLSYADASTKLIPLFDMLLEKFNCKDDYYCKMFFVGKGGRKKYARPEWLTALNMWLDKGVEIYYISVGRWSDSSHYDIKHPKFHEISLEETSASNKILRKKYMHFHPNFLKICRRDKEENRSIEEEILEGDCNYAIWLERLHKEVNRAKFVNFYPPAYIKRHIGEEERLQDIIYEIESLVKKDKKEGEENESRNGRKECGCN